MIKAWLNALLVIGLSLSSVQSSAGLPDSPQVQEFMARMVAEHRFDKPTLQRWLGQAEIKDSILSAMAKPAEAKPWYEYRKIFLTDERIAGGVKFWHDHAGILSQVEQRYGVPASIIVAIIGVETRYGQNVGKYRVIDALATLGFAYPKRSEFFLKELENFLLLCREQNIDPLQPVGSYAGAMGMPQFMPSSYRSYAADFDGDRFKDIWRNPADAIASVANYFAQHQWRPGETVVLPVVAKTPAYRALLGNDLKLDQTVAQIEAAGVWMPSYLSRSAPAKLLAYQTEQGEELWLGLNNFFVITRYNRSALYARAVFELSEAIKIRYQAIPMP